MILRLKQWPRLRQPEPVMRIRPKPPDLGANSQHSPTFSKTASQTRTPPGTTWPPFSGTTTNKGEVQHVLWLLYDSRSHTQSRSLTRFFSRYSQTSRYRQSSLTGRMDDPSTQLEDPSRLLTSWYQRQSRVYDHPQIGLDSQLDHILRYLDNRQRVQLCQPLHYRPLHLLQHQTLSTEGTSGCLLFPKGLFRLCRTWDRLLTFKSSLYARTPSALTMIDWRERRTG